ncbi:MAG: cache domain-containing protein [Pseudomonadota bacterium]|nr:cache domain-containing protein [Pseudomonadota bacterium]
MSEANLSGVYWYARPDGSYWTLEAGKAEANLADRSYFQRALRGEAVLGELVVSKSTAANVGVVAMPVRGRDGAVSGVIGVSVYLDQLSDRLREEMGLSEDVLFYAFDEQNRLALHSETEKLFLRAGELGPQVEEAFREIQTRKEGVISYTLEDRPRTVVFRQSPVTGWWYAFGVIGDVPPQG